MIVFFAGCASSSEEADEKQTDAYEGYTGTLIHKTGGVPIEQVNAKSISASEENGDLVLTLHFIKGSRISGSENEQELLSVPQYDVYALPTPCRLVIEMPALAYWDYLRTADFSAILEIRGYFQHILSDGDTVSLYIQLSRDFVFKTEEKDGMLSIAVKFVAEEETENTQEDEIHDLVEDDIHYYALADVYREYCSGVISREMDMTPTLTRDEETVVLISNPFDTPMEAESYLEKTMHLTQGSAESQWYTCELKDGELPPYSQEMNLQAALEQDIMRIDGNVQKGEVLLDDGLYLGTLPQKNGILYSKRLMETEITGDSYTYEQLYVRELNGNKKRLFPFEFETIESAKYSPDGRKLAVLERAAESAHLYVFDIEAKELLVDLAEIGFGDMVSSYTWDTLGSAIYAVSGSGSMQIHKYDFNVPDEAKRYSSVDKNGADEAAVAYCDGDLYFVETEMDQGAVIYRIKPDGGVRKRFTEGANFLFSPDAKYMAINDAAGDFENTGRQGSFRIFDMQTKQTQKVTDAFDVYSFFWSRDGLSLYYFENRLSGSANENEGTGDEVEAEQDAYPYTLWVYDIQAKQSKALMDLPVTSVYMGAISDKLYVCYMDEATMGQIVRATYSIDLTR